MEELAEKDTSPLKDSEITRLIDVSNNTGYKKQEAIPERNLIDFKPKSLLEIALKENNKDTNKEKKVDNQADKTGNPEAVIEDTQTSEAKLSDVVRETEVETLEPKESQDSKLSETNDVEEENKPKDPLEDVTSQQDKETQNNENSSEVKLGNTNEMNQAVERNEAEAKKNDIDPLTSAKQEGIEIGKNMAIAEAENNLAESSKALNSIIESLKDKDVLDKTDLMNSILTTITNIACERAGQIIDEHPKSFTEKILAFVDEIDKSSKKVILNLNPYDAKLIGSSVLEHFSENEIQIKENSALFRGDSILQIGSIEVGDIISDRISFGSETDNKGPEAQVLSGSTIISEADNEKEKSPPVKKE